MKKCRVRILMSPLKGLSFDYGGIMFQLNYHYEIRRLIFKASNDNLFNFQNDNMCECHSERKFNAKPQ